MFVRKLLRDDLVLATHNSGKIKEISSFLTQYGLKIKTAKELNLLEPLETGSTYLDNALIKARAASLALGLPVLADDSGVEVEALDNMPGLHTAPYTKEYGGLERVFHMWANDPAIQKNPRAAFISVLVLMWPDGYYKTVDAKVSGRLSFPKRGGFGHGYDPVFIPQGSTKTSAEMDEETKAAFSHRLIALKKLMQYLR